MQYDAIGLFCTPMPPVGGVIPVFRDKLLRGLLGDISQLELPISSGFGVEYIWVEGQWFLAYSI
jgi:hypothetical protein